MVDVTGLAQWLRNNREELARNAVNKQLVNMSFSDTQYHASLRDAQYNIDHLADAVSLQSPLIFNAYMLWLREILGAYGYQDSLLKKHLQVLGELLRDALDGEQFEVVLSYLEGACSTIDSVAEGDVSFIDPQNPHSGLAGSYLKSLLEAKKDEAIKQILSALESGVVTVEELYMEVFTPILYETGRLWQKRSISVGQEHFVTAATQYCMSRMYEHIFSHKQNGWKMIGTCVGDELHEVGIRMVCDIFEMHDWDTYYLGANLSDEDIVSEIQRLTPQILVLSATIPGHVIRCINIIKAVKSQYPKVSIMVGGRPFNQDPTLWNRIGADGFSRDAREAIQVAEGLVNNDDTE